MEREWTGNARRLSEADRAEIERRLQDGETFAAIGAAVGCSTKSIQRYLVLTGGIKQRRRERSALRLSLREREEISLGLSGRREWPAAPVLPEHRRLPSILCRSSKRRCETAERSS
jgi:hypothetical protein